MGHNKDAICAVLKSFRQMRTPTTKLTQASIHAKETSMESHGNQWLAAVGRGVPYRQLSGVGGEVAELRHVDNIAVGSILFCFSKTTPTQVVSVKGFSSHHCQKHFQRRLGTVTKAISKNSFVPK